MRLRLKLATLSFLNFLRAKFSFRRDTSEIEDIKESIEELKKKIDIVSSVAYDQSLIIVSLAKVQSEVVENLKTIDENYHSDNYLLVKIPIKDDDVVN